MAKSVHEVGSAHNRTIYLTRWDHKELLGHSRMGKEVVFPLRIFMLWNNSLFLKGIPTFFPHTRGKCAKREQIALVDHAISYAYSDSRSDGRTFPRQVLH